MRLAADAAITAALISIFCILHSVLASNNVKKAFRNRFGNFMAFYRIGYNIISIIAFVIIYTMLPKLDVIIYQLAYPFNYAAMFFQLISVVGIIWCGKYFSSGEFIGFNQVKRYNKGNYNPSELDEKLSIRIEGPYKYSRHPVYFFCIMFLILRPVIGLTYLIIVVIFALYFFIGSIFEEKRLVEKFGETYISYQKSVPRIIPIRVFKT